MADTLTRGKEHRFKVIVVGPATSGKTSVIRRYVKSSYSTSYAATIGVDFLLKVLSIGNDTRVSLQLWDIAAQERFGSMTPLYYRDAAACLVVFDITSKATFSAVEKWKQDVETKLGPDHQIPYVLLANKSDLAAENPHLQCASDEELTAFAEQLGFLKWYKTSAKEGENVADCMEFVVKALLDTVKDDSRDDMASRGLRFQTVRAQPLVPVARSSSSCCEVSRPSPK